MDESNSISADLRQIGEAPHRVLLGPAFADASVGVSIATLDGRIVEANTAFLRIVGRTAEQLATETISSITAPEHRDAAVGAVRALIAGDSHGYTQDRQMCRPDGSCIWVRNSVSLLRDSAGAPLYTMAITEDIDAMRRAQAGQAQALDTLEIATRAADVGIWDVDMLNGSMSWSPICRNIFGVPLDTPLTLDNFYAGLHPDDRSRLAELIARVADPDVRATYDAEYRVLRSDGEQRWAHATGRAYFEDSPEGLSRCARFVGTIRDITERRRSTEALIQAEKLAATGRLAASIAHEINNPLEAVTNLLFLLRDTTDEDQRRTFLALAEEEIKRVTAITTQTLRFYRDPSGPAACDICAIVDFALLQGRASLLGVDVAVESSAGFVIAGSQGELRQVMVNLIGNALDAMLNGGRLRLRIQNGHAGHTGPGIHVTIADTGQGMTPEVAARVFEPFFTTGKPTGTGLGLWLSLEILNRHGASIRLRSRPGEGTVVRLFFPLGETS